MDKKVTQTIKPEQCDDENCYEGLRLLRLKTTGQKFKNTEGSKPFIPIKAMILVCLISCS